MSDSAILDKVCAEIWGMPKGLWSHSALRGNMLHAAISRDPLFERQNCTTSGQANCPCMQELKSDHLHSTESCETAAVKSGALSM